MVKVVCIKNQVARALPSTSSGQALPAKFNQDPESNPASARCHSDPERSEGRGTCCSPPLPEPHQYINASKNRPWSGQSHSLFSATRVFTIFFSSASGKGLSDG